MLFGQSAIGDGKEHSESAGNARAAQPRANLAFDVPITDQ